MGWTSDQIKEVGQICCWRHSTDVNGTKLIYTTRVSDLEVSMYLDKINENSHKKLPLEDPKSKPLVPKQSK